MNHLQAAMRDKSAKTWRERITMYKVGSPMKGCRHCGDVQEDEETSRVRYLSGFQVFRAYKPWNTGWTWKCWECGATDLVCWAEDQLGLVRDELGKEPIVGSREAVASRKRELRKQASQCSAPARRSPQKLERIRELEEELERLRVVIEGARV